jgi:ribonuclease BN (tRNA processing enzyme)
MSGPQAEATTGPPPVELVNGGDLSLTFVGVGSAFSKKYFQNNLLVVKGDSHLLVDCGSRTPEALHRLGLSVGKVRNYLVTHTHADHIGGLEEVMLVNRYAIRQKPTLVLPEALRDVLWPMCLRGGASFNESRDGTNLELEDYWQLAPTARVEGADRELAAIEMGGISLRIFRTAHIPDSAPSWRESFPSYGLIIDDRVLYSSDTRFDRELVEGFDREYGFEAIFHDCQLFTGGVHASLEELGTLPASIRERMTLMHFGDNVESFAPRIAELGFAALAEQWKTYSFPSRARPAGKVPGVER